MRQIYVLFNKSAPENIRYVGESSDVSKRIKAHIGHTNSGVDRHVYDWIRTLEFSVLTRKNSLKHFDVGYKVIAIVEDYEAVQTETRLMALLKTRGHNLLNMNHGGYGGILGSSNPKAKIRGSKEASDQGKKSALTRKINGTSSWTNYTETQRKQRIENMKKRRFKHV